MTRVVEIEMSAYSGGRHLEELDSAKRQAASYTLLDVKKLSDKQREDFMQHKFSTVFPTPLVIILHFVTGGIFTLFYYGFKHSQLPFVKQDDFGAARAIGFLFIPFFNIYWIFRFWLRLADGVNFQFALRDRPPPVWRENVRGAVIVLLLGFIPYAGLVCAFLSFSVLLPISLAEIQVATNTLAKEAQLSTPHEHLISPDL